MANLTTAELSTTPLKESQVRDSYCRELWLLINLWGYSPTDINKNIGVANSKISHTMYDDYSPKLYEVELFKDMLRNTVNQAKSRLATLDEFNKSIINYKISVTQQELMNEL